MIQTLLFFIPFAVNIFVLIQYIFTKNLIYRKWFFLTAFTGFGLLGVATLLSSFIPILYKTLDFSLLFWLLSGYLMAVSLCVKILIFRRVYLRYQDPHNFHYNFFGKKVMHSGFLTNREMKNFFVTIPLFLFAGAYFVARLINLIRHGHL
jgi:hypothetical protein